MKVAVVGAGIMGAASAYYLAKAGAVVHIFDANARPAQGVTANAFGWINTINGFPGSQAFNLRMRAVAEYKTLLCELPELEAFVKRGALLWKSDPEETIALAALHPYDQDLALIPAKAIAAIEPHLLKAPPIAIYSPHDIAISPVAMVEAFLQRAQNYGATIHLSTGQVRLWHARREVKGLQTAAGNLAFDLVVLTAGASVGTLLSEVGVSLGVQASPVVLLRYSCNHHLLRNVISSPELEVRQAADGTLLMVEDFFPGCEQQRFALLRQRMQSVMDKYLRFSGDAAFQSGAVGQRPMPWAGTAERGFAKGLSGLYYLVGHPGVILAPLLAREAAEEIT